MARWQIRMNMGAEAEAAAKTAGKSAKAMRTVEEQLAREEYRILPGVRRGFILIALLIASVVMAAFLMGKGKLSLYPDFY